ncbi:hypothetical protein GJAV_G00235210 [Gymnothorax javanicus]|nr:hypothetical protein GJAV_G00235210 [Gymnothorax javanicus]
MNLQISDFYLLNRKYSPPPPPLRETTNDLYPRSKARQHMTVTQSQAPSLHRGEKAEASCTNASACSLDPRAELDIAEMFPA